MAKKVKKKLNKKGLIVILLSLYLIVMIMYYIFTLPIKTIKIIGNKQVTDNEIIEIAGIKEYPTLIKANGYKLKKNILKIELINDVKIKKSVLGNLTIEVVENDILFYNMISDSYVLSNGKEVKYENVMGVPTLINFTPNDIYNKFIEGLTKINLDIIKMISEIEYSPDISNDVTLDDSRFLLKMNDGNYVYINVVNIEKLNKYIDAIAAIEGEKKGVLYLDSNSSNNYFKTFKSIEAEKEGANDELSKEAN